MSVVHLSQRENNNCCTESDWKRGSGYGCRWTLVQFVCGVRAPDLIVQGVHVWAKDASAVSTLLIVKENVNMTNESNTSSRGQTTSSRFVYKLFSFESVALKQETFNRTAALKYWITDLHTWSNPSIHHRYDPSPLPVFASRKILWVIWFCCLVIYS